MKAQARKVGVWAAGWVALATVAGSLPIAGGADEAPVAIFNGKDLDGWKGDGVHWSVEDGAITGKTTPTTALAGYNTFLVYEKAMPSDFTLTARYKITGGNSGIQYRSAILDPAKMIVGGYQADIDSTPRFTGINYEERGRGILAERGRKMIIGADGNKEEASLGDAADLQTKIKAGDWNDYKIEAVGNHLTHSINGVVMSEVIDKDTSKAKAQGVIALQLHAGMPMTVRFKDVMLTERK